MNPHVDGSDGQKRFEARGNTLPTDHQAAVFLLEPGKCALGLEPRDHFFNRSAPVFLGLPDSFRDVCPDPTLPQLCCRSTFASYPLSVAMTLRRLRGRPRFPVRTCTASSSGR